MSQELTRVSCDEIWGMMHTANLSPQISHYHWKQMGFAGSAHIYCLFMLMEEAHMKVV